MMSKSCIYHTHIYIGYTLILIFDTELKQRHFFFPLFVRGEKKIFNLKKRNVKKCEVPIGTKYLLTIDWLDEEVPI